MMHRCRCLLLASPSPGRALPRISSSTPMRRRRLRHRSFATRTNAACAAGTSAAGTSSFTDVDAHQHHHQQQQKEHGVLGDLLRTLPARARDISSRVPRPRPTSSLPITHSTDGPAARRYDASSKKDESGAAAAMADLSRATDAAAALLALTASPALRNSFASRGDSDGLDTKDDKKNSNNNNKRKGKGTEVDAQSGGTAVLDQDAVESLHFALLAVSSWLQTSVREAAAASRRTTQQQSQHQQGIDEAIVAAIDLTVRSADLALPLTPTLYRTLASDVVAAHSSPSSHPSLQVMEVANLLRVALFPAFDPPPVAFFHGPCVALVQRGLVREAIDLLDEMDAEFGITEVDAGTGMEMLSAVAEGMGVGVANSGGGSESQASIVFGKAGRNRSSISTEFDPVDATELVFRLRGPLLRQLDDASKELRREMDRSAEGAEASAELVDLLESLSRPADGDANADNDPDASAIEAVDDNDVPSEILGEYDLEADSSPEDTAGTLADIETLSDAVSSLAEDGTGPSPKGVVGQSSRAPGLPMYSTYQIPQSLHDQMASEMIYVRKGPSWDLPDLAEQLRSLNNGREILYTKKYEEDLISSMMRDWDEDEEYDDIDYDDDEEERER